MDSRRGGGVGRGRGKELASLYDSDDEEADLGTRQASSPPVAATAAVKEVSDIKVGPPKEVVKARYAEDEIGSGDLKKLSLGTPPVTTPRAVSSIRDDEDDDDVPVVSGGRGRGIIRPGIVSTPKLVPVAPIGIQEEVVEAPAAAALGEDNDGDSVVSVPTTKSASTQGGSITTTSITHAGAAAGVGSHAGSAGGESVATSSVFPMPTEASQWSGSEVAPSSDISGFHRKEKTEEETPPIPSVIVVPARKKQQRVRTEQKIHKGDKGDITAIATNFVRMNYINKGKIYEYHVEFEPHLDSTKMKKKAMRDLMEDRAYSFDGTMLFLSEKTNGDILTYNVKQPATSEPLTITAAFVKEKDPDELIQFFNILFKQMMRALGRVQLRRNYYDIENIKTLAQHRLDIWPGYCIAVEEQEGGLMLCLDVSHRVLRQDTVLEQYFLMKGSIANWQEKFTEFMVGKIVLTRYNNMCYKIDDIWWDSHPTDTFTKKDREISYIDYYNEQHGVPIKHKEQPLLVSRIKPRRGDLIQEEKIVALIPELCFITGLTDDQRSNFTVMKDLGEHTRLSPAQRKLALERFIKEINGTPTAKKVLAQWNMELESGPLQLEGRIHGGAKLNFGKREVVAGPDFQRDALTGVISSRDVNKYLLICTQRDADKGKRFVETYRTVCKQLGIQHLGTPVVLPIKGQQVNDFRRAIKDNLTKEANFQFLFCLMPQQRDDLYSLIKKLSIADLEIPSQCCLTRTLSNEKKFVSVIQRIALQINCKLGGALWALKLPFETPVMFVGIDVCHDPKKKDPSVLGLVATLNNECTKYVSLCRILKVHQETADSLKSAFDDALQTYHDAKGYYPERIVVWRDGGMADPTSFNQHEVQQVQKSISDNCPTLTKFSFVVVQKRIPQRFFKTDRMGKNWENPTPGTVIDHTVTNYNTYDFYVVSQLVRQGTVSPTHYTVIVDCGDTKPDLLQKFAYVCSFMYYNWPGTVRVPAMVQYAHKLASLVGTNIRGNPGKSLRETLYYL